jgi:anti-anti-sigma factor
MRAVVSDERQDRGAHEGLTRVPLAGPLTAATAATLRARVRDAIASGRRALELDLHAVTALDAAGIAALLDARRTLLAQAGGTLVLRTNALVCRALKGSGTIAAFALSNGSGM